MSRVHILGTHNCGKERFESFKRRIKQHGLLCWRDYSERILSRFAHQIQSEYYCGNCSVYIEGVSLDHSSASNQANSQLISETVSRQAVFCSFLLDYRKICCKNSRTQ